MTIRTSSRRFAVLALAAGTTLAACGSSDAQSPPTVATTAVASAPTVPVAATAPSTPAPSPGDIGPTSTVVPTEPATTPPQPATTPPQPAPTDATTPIDPAEADPDEVLGSLESPDACALVSPEEVAAIVGQPYDAGAVGLGLPPESRCELAGGTTGIDVAFTVNPGAAAASTSPFLSREGFEGIFGPTVDVPGLALPAFAHFDDEIIGQAAVLATNGSAYVLVTFTGDPVTQDSIPTVAAVADLVLGRLLTSG